MSDDNRAAIVHHTPQRQAGTTAVEFSLLALLFFTLVFGVIEVMRLGYVYNTLQEVTRRAARQAALVYPSDGEALARIRQDAVFRTTAGPLVFASPVTDANVRIDYFALVRGPDLTMHLQPVPDGSWPSCAAQHRLFCMANPNAPTCIRFVRVRVCDAGNTEQCRPVQSETLIPLIALRPALHIATTIVNVEAFGYRPNLAPCAQPGG